jgi:hypothetical protein
MVSVRKRYFTLLGKFFRVDQLQYCVTVGWVGRIPVAGGMLPIVRADGTVLLARENGSHMTNELAVSVHVAPGLFVLCGRHRALLDPAPLDSANRRRLIKVESPQYPAAPSHSSLQKK